MIIEKIIEKSLSFKIPNVIFFNNFSEDLYDIIIRIVIDKIKDKEKYELIKIINSSDKQIIEIIEDNISDYNFFDTGKMFIIYSCNNLKIFDKIFSNKDCSNHYFLIFIKVNSFVLKNISNFKIIEFPRYLRISKIVYDYFFERKININSDVLKMFDNYFSDYSIEIENILDKIYIYLKENNINSLNREIVQKFLFLSNRVVYYELSDLFFKREIKKFFLLYKEFVIQQNGFEKFLYVFINEVKVLLLISEIYQQSNNEQFILSSLEKLGINYNRYRLKYDLIKINTFGRKKFKELLSFLLYCEYSLRRYQKSNVQLIFEVKITEFSK